MKKIIFTTLLGFILFIPITYSMDNKTTPITIDDWDVTFGGIHSDSGKYVQQTNDGGYIILGNTMSFGNGGNNIWLIKTDENGNKIWEKIFGGSDFDRCSMVKQTSDDGYIIAGYTNSFSVGSLEDIWLIKTDENGNKIWNKTYGGIGGEGGFSGQQTHDNGFIFVGSTTSYGNGYIDVWLVKTDNSGNELWNKTFSITENDVGWSVQQTNDNGFIITGFTGDSSAISSIALEGNSSLYNLFLEDSG